MNLKWHFFTEISHAPSENDTTTKPGDTKTPIVNNTIEDPSNARCQELIKDFEAKEDQLKQYYKNGHATKVFVLINIYVIATCIYYLLLNIELLLFYCFITLIYVLGGKQSKSNRDHNPPGF